MTKLGNGTNFHDTITLADLEMALSRCPRIDPTHYRILTRASVGEMTAAVYWAGRLHFYDSSTGRLKDFAFFASCTCLNLFVAMRIYYCQ